MKSPIARFLAELGELGTPEVEEFLWSIAFPENTSTHIVRIAAETIHDLAKIDSVTAFRAACTRFSSDDKDQVE